MVELITDRTQYHVTLLNRLRKKAWSSMTASEQSSWNGDAAKGAYNYADLNRVETAVAELAGELGLNLTTKTNWTLWDIPTRSEMERYLGNVVAIRDACPGSLEFPSLPSSMNGLTYTSANSIEMVLQMVYEKINEPETPDVPVDPEHKCVLGEFIIGECVLGEDSDHPGSSDTPTEPDVPDVPDVPEGSEDADFVRSGELYCGEVL